VSRLIGRRRLWSDDTLKPYRSFYNVLAHSTSRGVLKQVETFHPYHRDWRQRAAAPVVLFDGKRSAFQLDQPVHVARFEPESGIPERWRSDRVSRRLEKLLFTGRSRRLRTSSIGYQHAKLVLRIPADRFKAVRNELIDIAKLAR
jgi:hypothetical protein